MLGAILQPRCSSQSQFGRVSYALPEELWCQISVFGILLTSSGIKTSALQNSPTVARGISSSGFLAMPHKFHDLNHPKPNKHSVQLALDGI